MNKGLYAGLDIGSSKIALAVGYIDDERIWRLKCFEKISSGGVSKGEIKDEDIVKKDIEILVKRIKKNTDITGLKYVNVGISGQSVKNIKNRETEYLGALRRIEQKDLQGLLEKSKRVMMEQGEQVVGLYPMEYVVDRNSPVANPVGETGKKLSAVYNVVVTKSILIDRIKSCLAYSGLKVKDFVLTPIASGEAILSDIEKRHGVAVVDIGANTTSIAVYFNNILKHAAVIPFGASTITNDIKTRFDLSFRQAEAAKMLKGVAYRALVEREMFNAPTLTGENKAEIDTEELAYVIQCRMEEIIDGVNYQLKMSQVQDKLKSGIVLCGGGASLNGIADLTEIKTGKKVRVGLPNTDKISAEGAANSPGCAAVLGLMSYTNASDFKSGNGIKKMLGKLFK